MAAEEWNREAAFRVNGALDNFEVMRGQFGVRNGIRAEAASSRKPCGWPRWGVWPGSCFSGAGVRRVLQCGRLRASASLGTARIVQLTSSDVIVQSVIDGR